MEDQNCYVYFYPVLELKKIEYRKHLLCHHMFNLNVRFYHYPLTHGYFIHVFAYIVVNCIMFFKRWLTFYKVRSCLFFKYRNLVPFKIKLETIQKYSSHKVDPQKFLHELVCWLDSSVNQLWNFLRGKKDSPHHLKCDLKLILFNP